MNKKCCDIRVEKIENGFCIKVTGTDVKDKCCSEEEIRKCIEKCFSIENCCTTETCCPSGK